MAPARMMQFVDQHIDRCATCQMDPVVAEEVEKIREFVVPESKIPKAIRAQGDRPTPEISPDEDDNEYTDNGDDSSNGNSSDDIESLEENGSIDVNGLDKQELI